MIPGRSGIAVSGLTNDALSLGIVYTLTCATKEVLATPYPINIRKHSVLRVATKVVYAYPGRINVVFGEPPNADLYTAITALVDVPDTAWVPHVPPYDADAEGEYTSVV